MKNKMKEYEELKEIKKEVKMKNLNFSDVICIILARGGSKGLKKI